MSSIKPLKKDNGEIVIIGCGRLGADLAGSCFDDGASVSVIDRNKDAFLKLGLSFGGLAIIGNATDIEVLSQAKISGKTTVVCLTNNENINIMAAQLARALFGAGRVIARLYDPEKTIVYEDQGIETICPSTLSAEAIGRLLTYERTMNRSFIQQI